LIKKGYGGRISNFTSEKLAAAICLCGEKERRGEKRSLNKIYEKRGRCAKTRTNETPSMDPEGEKDFRVFKCSEDDAYAIMA